MFHSILRKMTSPTVDRLRLPTQLGGFRHQQTICATLHLRAFGQAATLRGLSQATLFLDVKNALDAMLREHVCGGDLQTCPGPLRAHLEAEGLDWDQLCAETASDRKSVV